MPHVIHAPTGPIVEIVSVLIIEHLILPQIDLVNLVPIVSVLTDFSLNLIINSVRPVIILANNVVDLLQVNVDIVVTSITEL